MDRWGFEPQRKWRFHPHTLSFFAAFYEAQNRLGGECALCKRMLYAQAVEVKKYGKMAFGIVVKRKRNAIYAENAVTDSHRCHPHNSLFF